MGLSAYTNHHLPIYTILTHIQLFYFPHILINSPLGATYSDQSTYQPIEL